jgi:hypothetical protein
MRLIESKNAKNFGYKIVSSDGKGGAVSIYDKKVKVDISIGSIVNNTHLGNSAKYVNDYFRSACDPEDAQDILMKLEYRLGDVIHGDPNFENGEVKVRSARVVKVVYLPRYCDDTYPYEISIDG